jgi:hypothetical protein
MIKPAPVLRRFPPAATAALLAVAALWALLETFGPRGFALRDESMVLAGAKRFAEGGGWNPAWGRGSLTRWLQYRLMALGSWRFLHIPILLAVVSQSALFARLGRRLGGPRVAQGALLAGVLSAAFLVQARSLLPFAVLPCLLALSMLGLLRGGAWAAAGGFVAALGLLEYEGVLLALPGLAAMSLFEPHLKDRAGRWFMLGALLALPLVLGLSLHSLQDWWRYRLMANPIHGDAAGALRRVWQWFTGGPTQPFMGVSGHSAFPLWALPLALLGLATQARRRPWLWLWFLACLAAQIPGTPIFEPQRSIAALPVLCLAAGFGWAAAWRWSRSRRGLALALLCLPVLGLALELRAFDRSMRAGQEHYNRSQAWMGFARAHGGEANLDASLLPLGFAMEAVHGSRPGLPREIWVPLDFAADAPAWPGRLMLDNAGQATDMVLRPPAADPLLMELAALRGTWLRFNDERSQQAQLCREALAYRNLRSPLARLALWQVLMDNTVRAGQFTPADFDALAREHFRSPSFYQRFVQDALERDPALAGRLLQLGMRKAGAKNFPADWLKR